MMGGRTMSRRLRTVACTILLAGLTLTIVSGQEAFKEGIDDTLAEVGQDTMGDGVQSLSETIGDIEEIDTTVGQDISNGLSKAEEKIKSIFTGGVGDSSSGGGESRSAKSNKMCKFSFKTRTCEPSAFCKYQYQFLDATPSESCRLKGFQSVRKMYPQSDKQMKPAAVITGAAGLFAADLFAIRYTDWLQRFPLAFNIAQGFVLFVSGDALFQVIEQGWKKVVGVKYWRMIRSGLIGALNNGLIHFSWYKWIDRNFPYYKFSEKTWGPADGAKSKLAIGLTKWAIEWPTIGAYKILSMYILTAVMGNGTDGLKERLKDGFFLTWLRSLQVWPIYDMLLYAYVPTEQRPLFNSFMSILWGGYLSHVSQPFVADDVEEEDLTLPEKAS